MLLIWLLLIPSAAAFDCRGACNLCDAMNKNSATAACTLCSECMKTQSRRMWKQNKQETLLTDQQEEELRNLKRKERREFKQVMKEYGLKPDELHDKSSISSMEEIDKSTYDSQDCVTLANCIAINEDNSGKQLKAKKTLTLQQPTAITQDCPTTTTSTQCPPIKPCKRPINKLVGFNKPYTQSTIPSFLRNSIMRNIETLNLDYEVDDQGTSRGDRGCPIQPICPDDDDYGESVTKRPLVFTTTTSTTTCRPKRLLKKRIPHTPQPTPCVPCMPYCALPCGFSQMPPFLPASLSLAALEALITLKSLKNNIKHVADIGKTEVMLTKGDHKESTEETTKEFMYFYVGIPKDVKNVEGGLRKRY